MPLLPLPVGGSNLTGGDLPVQSDSDVLTEFPRPQRNPPVAPVRDVFVSGWAEGFKAYQDIAARAAAQSDPTQATGEYLKDFAEEHAVIPGVNESEDSVRSRLFSAPKIVTPNVIVDAVNSLLATHTTKTCTLSELELDGMFAHDGTGIWDCFVGANPNYPDRYYSDIPSLLPGGAVPSAGYPRSFLIRIPVLDTNNDDSSYALNTDNVFAPNSLYQTGIFVDDGTTDGTVIGVNMFADPQTADDIYSSIVGLVTNIKGQGISFGLVVDPTL